MAGSGPSTSTLSTLGRHAGLQGLEELTAAGQGWVHCSGKGRGRGLALKGEQQEEERPGGEQHGGQLLVEMMRLGMIPP